MRCFCSDYQTELLSSAFHSNVPLLVQSFTPYRTAQRPIVTATQVGSHIRVGEACGSAVQLVFAMSPSFLGWQFAPSFWAVLRALSSLGTSLIELSEWIKWYPPMMFKSFSWMTFKFQVLMSKVLQTMGGAVTFLFCKLCACVGVWFYFLSSINFIVASNSFERPSAAREVQY